MVNFIVRRRLDLADVGDEWKDCFIVFRDLTVEEVQNNVSQIASGKNKTEEQIGMIKDLLAACFIEGKGYDGKAIVDIKKEDLGNLPLSVYTRSFDFLAKASGGDK